jgi:steroid 5-alpha reductase family enzyme
MAVLWGVQRRKGEADIVDFGWTISLGFLGAIYSWLGTANLFVRTYTGIFAALWAFRLGLHLWQRVNEPGEDGRYVALRQHWGTFAQRNFFVFFQAQALLAIVLSLSFFIPSTQASAAGDLQVLAALTWFIFSIGGETLSDMQLRRWRDNPANRGKTCRAGLWKYSRHPNYFFEWLYWFSYVILAFGAPYWGLTLISPAIILFSILKVTGIPPTEERALRTRGDDYKDYQRTTSAFVPWLPLK